jgi:sterol desaturase/sphingolipid hydroxylase (fatty acid hydroxylase superfamily)
MFGHLLPPLSMLMLMLGAMAFCTIFEILAPARKSERPDKSLNIAIGLVFMLLQATFGAAFGPAVTLAVNAAGGGLITLPSTGLGLVVGIAVFCLSMDLGDYLFHRAQHAWPWMWAMHSLHHSDPAFGTTTTVRHFWFEPMLKAMTTYLVVGLIFKAAPAILLSWVVLSYYNFISHSNVRLGFGRASWLINSPQYHRMHHSSASEYSNCNFASIFPIFDVIAGSYRRPRAGEYPATGIDTGEFPRSIVEAVCWPLRGRAAALSNAGQA